MKIAGIIGGQGPSTTAEFYLELLAGCQKQNLVARPSLLIWNVPANFRVEKEILTHGTNPTWYLPRMLDAAQRLEAGGVDFLTIPCNSMHVFIDDLRRSTKVPVLSIVEETVAVLKKEKINRVGLLATPLSVRQDLHRTALESAGVQCVLPNSAGQAKLGKLINNIVLNKQTNQDREDLLRIVATFETQGIQNILLACTDLRILLPKKEGVTFFDTTKILADATVEEILK